MNEPRLNNEPDKKPAKRIKKLIPYSDKFTDFVGPKYWLTWIGLCAMALVAQLPHRLVLFLGKCFGYILFTFAHSRRRIARANTAMCFPELSGPEQKAFVKKTMLDNGVGLIEMCIAWFNHKSITDDMIEVHGEQHLIDALNEGRGVILVGAHYTTLDLGGVLMAKVKKVGVMYRSLKNPLFDLMMRRSREKFCQQVIERNDMRSVIRFIRKGGVMWYAPDQDYGRKQSVFAPFFGIEAATITSLPKLVKINKSVVLMLGHHRKTNAQGYIVSISEPVKNYPSGDDREDARIINAELETRIREYPEQYMWLHRRFKTRPEGEAPLYKKSE